ncbi:hypothetical protein, partial [Enterobacter cloacae complex sp. 742-ADZ3-9B]|uniref:hypothetical protein n=1 Tax=Enterobacter cloacae complex sp. 742-ADZ3-9B TaxID=2511992 RepID=UPI001E5AB9E7
RRADRYTDFNDLAVNSSLGREGVAMQLKAIIADQLNKKSNSPRAQPKRKKPFRKKRKNRPFAKLCKMF